MVEDEDDRAFLLAADGSQDLQQRKFVGVGKRELGMVAEVIAQLLDGVGVIAEVNVQITVFREPRDQAGVDQRRFARARLAVDDQDLVPRNLARQFLDDRVAAEEDVTVADVVVGKKLVRRLGNVLRLGAVVVVDRGLVARHNVATGTQRHVASLVHVNAVDRSFFRWYAAGHRLPLSAMECPIDDVQMPGSAMPLPGWARRFRQFQQPSCRYP